MHAVRQAGLTGDDRGLSWRNAGCQRDEKGTAEGRRKYEKGTGEYLITREIGAIGGRLHPGVGRIAQCDGGGVAASRPAGRPKHHPGGAERNGTAVALQERVAVTLGKERKHDRTKRRAEIVRRALTEQ